MYLFLPVLEDTASVSVSYVGSHNTLGVPALGSSSAVSYYVAAAYTYTEPEDMALALRLHQTIRSGGRREMAKREDDFAQTVVPYDIRFDYRDKSGKGKTWYYDRASLAELRALLSLEQSAVAATAAQTALGGDIAVAGTVYAREAYLRGKVYLADMTYRDIRELTLSDDLRKDMLACVRKDTAAQSLTDRYFPAGEPLAVMMFAFGGGNSVETFAYRLNNAFLFLSEDAYPSTLAFLRTQNLWFDEARTALAASTDPAAIETLLFQTYDPYIGINKPSFPQSPYFMSYLSQNSADFRVIKDFGSANVVRDPAQIAAISSRFRSFYFLSESGSFAAVKYKGSDKWVYKFVPDSP
jgi:hypothetical protein